MPTSLEWRTYFENNARSLMQIPWELGPELTSEESADIAESLKEFQAGENSEGKHLYKYAQQYAEKNNDPEYLAAIRLFIAEEQRHARDLGRFLTMNNIALVRTTVVDRVFRMLRNMFGGLEISIAVLITAEIIAKVYYAVIREATNSQVLRRICEQLLSDELRHVQFQAEQLAKLRAGRGWVRRGIASGFQRLLYLGAVGVVGIFHRRAIRRGGLSVVEWWRWCWKEFNEAFALGDSVRAADTRNPLPAVTTMQ